MSTETDDAGTPPQEDGSGDGSGGDAAPMDSRELWRRMDDARLTPMDLRDVGGWNIRTVLRWVRGDPGFPIPPEVAAYLRALTDDLAAAHTRHAAAIEAAFARPVPARPAPQAPGSPVARLERVRGQAPEEGHQAAGCNAAPPPPPTAPQSPGAAS